MEEQDKNNKTEKFRTSRLEEDEIRHGMKILESERPRWEHAGDELDHNIIRKMLIFVIAMLGITVFIVLAAVLSKIMMR